MSSHSETVKTVGDVAAGSVAIGAFISWLPPLAALCAIAWTLWRFYESIERRVVCRRKRRHYLKLLTELRGEQLHYYKYMSADQLQSTYLELTKNGS